MRIAVYTAITNLYDPYVPSVEQTVPCDYFCFTDKPEALSDPSGRTTFVKITHALRPTSNRYLLPFSYRMLPYDIPELESYDLLIYMDGMFSISDVSTVERLLKEYPIAEHALTLIQHPRRDCVYDEIEVSRRMPKYHTIDLAQQSQAYKEAGLPERWGLWTNNRMIWNRTVDLEATRRMQEIYWEEVQNYRKPGLEHWAIQGQVCLPFALWRSELAVLSLPSSEFAKGWTQHAHQRRITATGEIK